MPTQAQIENWNSVHRAQAEAARRKAEERANFDAMVVAASQRREAFNRGEQLPMEAPPTLDSIYSQAEALRKAEELKDRHKKALIEATRPLTDFELQHMPPTDARIIEWKKRAINKDYYAALEAAALEAKNNA